MAGPQASYSIIITADAAQADHEIAKLAATTSAASSTMDASSTKVAHLGQTVTGLTPGISAADREFDRATQRASSFGRTIETSLLNGNTSGLNSALAGIATQGGMAGIALGSVAVASVIAYAAASKAAGAYADQALAMEKAAKAAGVLTPEMGANADEARAYQASTQKLSDTFSDMSTKLGKNVIPALISLTDLMSNLISASDKVTGTLGKLFSTFDLGAVSINGFPVGQLIQGLFQWSDAQSNVNDTNAESLRRVEALAQAEKDHVAALAAETAAATQYAQDEIGAQRAVLSLEELRVSWAQKVSDAETKKAADIKAAQDSIATAAQHTRDVETQAASSIANAKDAVRAAQERLRQDSLQDLRGARNLADAQLAIERAREDAASGRTSGESATRAITDAETNLARVQQDNGIAARDQAQRVQDDQAAVAKAQKAQRDAEVKASNDIRAAHDAERAAVDKLRQAQREAGISALDRRKHELDLQSAILLQSAAQQKLNGDLATMKKNIADGTWEWSLLKTTLEKLHVSTFPAIKRDLADISQGVAYGAGSSYTVGGSTYNSQVPRAAAGSGGTGAPTVVVNTGALVLDRATMPMIAAAVAKEIQKLRNNGTNVGW